ncbi:MAG: bifunctional serine/threonine-protein kinase/formylglycine-generating enzyme family protein [Verrucomicrobiota bacterium]
MLDTPDDPDAPAPPGEIFGEYDLLEQLASGGMGVVYKAWHRTLERPVALKMIRFGGVADQQTVQRFRVEAMAAAQMDHPCIVPIYDVGNIDGQHYYSMALVDGPNLSEWIADQGRPSPKKAAEIIRQVAEAVHFSHQRGIVHRDIKPNNILLGDEATPRITDFGLAKSSGTELTVTGQLIGTPGFMSPEQARSDQDAVGISSDAYSIGATFYFLLTGQPPFSAASITETIRKVIAEEPRPPRRADKSVPPDLEVICLKCLEKNPHRRYASALALAEDLGRWLDGKPILARRVGPAERGWLWCKRRPAMAISTVAVILTLLGAWSLLTRQADSYLRLVLAAPPEELPDGITRLRPLQSYARPKLRACLADAGQDLQRRIRAAMALAHLAEVPADFLVDNIADIAPSECANLVAALRVDTSSSLTLLRTQFAKAVDVQPRARLAILGWLLGDPTMFETLSHRGTAPSRRIRLWLTLKDWHGAPDDLIRAGSMLKTPAAQSILCRALARMPARSMPAAVRSAWEPLLRNWSTNAPEAELHAAATWALRSRGIALDPSGPTPSPPAGSEWHINANGLTMVIVPAGRFIRKDLTSPTPREQEVVLTRPFLIADREIPMELFQRFRQDPDYPAERKPSARKKTGNPAPGMPAGDVSWRAAVQFCNWLSHQERLTPCYRLRGEIMTRVAGANGYRLPTEAEWEFACRAGSPGDFSTGEETALLEEEAVYMADAPAVGGSKAPNRFGLFDMHGNLREWCHDFRAPYAEGTTVTNPPGAVEGRARVLRGGSYLTAGRSLRASVRAYNTPFIGVDDFGFRVARNLPLHP